MSLTDRLGLAFLHQFGAEESHEVGLWALKTGLAAKRPTPTSNRLATNLAGLDLPNPVGLAAGLDKNAVALPALLQAGFGFVELGTVTPRPQPGNARPRLFRLADDNALINRFGFNNDGMVAVAARLAKPRPSGIVGINLGANKDSEDKAADFATVLATTSALVDFATINVSSPNTEKLRDLQGPDALRAVLDTVLETRARLEAPIPVFVKIAPDLEPGEIDAITSVLAHAPIDGLIATNTTLSRTGVKGPFREEPGGLSGPPLFDKSTRILAAFRDRLGPQMPIIGVGGISSADDAIQKIRAGASALQLYTALIYQGLGLAARIATGLDHWLEQNGFASVKEASGTGIADWR